LPSTWSCEPAQWVVRALSLVRARGEGGSEPSGDELTFLEGALRLQKAATRSAQRTARPLLESVVAAHPQFAEGWSLLARARFADADRSGAEASVRSALLALECVPPSSDLGLATVASELKLERPTKARLLSSLRWMYIQSGQVGASERIRELAHEELTLAGVDRLEVLEHLAQATSALGRHDETLAALQALLAAGDADEEGERHYWLARESMRAEGRHKEALAALLIAIERDARDAHKFASKARKESLFEPLRQQPEFISAVYGELVAVKPAAAAFASDKTARLGLGYPASLPFSREALASFCAQPEDCAQLRKSFLALVMLPIEERIGKWYFAGKATSFAQALSAIEDFAESAQLRRKGTLIEDILADEQVMEFAANARSAWSYDALPLHAIGPHTLVFLAEGGAPHDDFAVCLLEVPSFKQAPLARRKPGRPRHE
jgi:tetratricopeptide (TPR) repeat protein